MGLALSMEGLDACPLEESAALLKFTLRAARAGSWAWDIRTGNMFWSEEYLHLLGAAAPFTGPSYDNWLRAVHPDDRSRAAQATQSAIAEERELNMDYRVVRSDGVVRWMNARGETIYGPKREPLRMVGVTFDVTARKNIEESLARREEELRVITDGVPVLISYVDRDQRYVFTNKRYEEWFGQSSAQLKGRHVREIVGDLAYARVRPHIEAALAGSETRFELPLVYRGAGKRCVEVRYVPDLRIDGKVHGFFALINDITAQKSVETALRESEERFRTAIESMSDCLGIYTAQRDEHGKIADFRIDYVNAAACDNNVMERNDQLGRMLCDLLPSHRQSGLFDEYCRVVESGQSLVKETFVYEDSYGRRNLTRCFDIRAEKLGDGFVAVWRDVTRTMREQEELRARKAQICEQLAEIDQIYKYTPVGLFAVDRDLRFLRLNERMAMLNGLPIDMHIGRTLHEILPADLMRNLEGLWAPVLERGEAILDYELRGTVPRSPKEPLDWIVNYHPLRSFSGEIVGVMGSVMDITERKRAERALREHHAVLQTVLDSTDDFIFMKDAECRYVAINASAARAIGRSVADVVGKHDTELFPADYARAIVARDHRVMAEGQTQTFEETCPLGGRSVELLTVKSPCRDADGKVIGVVGVSRDITLRKRAEDALMQSEQKFRQLAESLPHIAYTTTPEGMADYVNGRWEEYSGRPVSESWGTVWMDSLHPEDREPTSQRFHRSLESGEPFECEYRFRRADGVYRWHLSRALPVRDSEGRIVKWIGTSTDIDDTKQAVHLLREHDRLKDEFLATLAHELRNPLAPIMTSMEVMRVSADPKMHDRARKVIERQVNHLKRLVDDLMDVSRITQGKLELRRELVELVSVLEGAMEVSRPLLEAHGHMVSIEIEAEPVVYGDTTRLTQVFLNLLNNAAKYTPNGGRIWLRAMQEEGDAVVSVRDTGIGIPEHMLSRIFDMYSQVHPEHQNVHSGLGIGLTLVKRLVELHGGRVSVRSAGANQGTTVEVRLPVLATSRGHA